MLGSQRDFGRVLRKLQEPRAISMSPDDLFEELTHATCLNTFYDVYKHVARRTGACTAGKLLRFGWALGKNVNFNKISVPKQLIGPWSMLESERDFGRILRKFRAPRAISMPPDDLFEGLAHATCLNTYYDVYKHVATRTGAYAAGKLLRFGWALERN